MLQQYWFHTQHRDAVLSAIDLRIYKRHDITKQRRWIAVVFLAAGFGNQDGGVLTLAWRRVEKNAGGGCILTTCHLGPQQHTVENCNCSAKKIEMTHFTTSDSSWSDVTGLDNSNLKGVLCFQLMTVTGVWGGVDILLKALEQYGTAILTVSEH